MVDSSDLIAIAVITRPRGLRGETVAKILTDFPERFENLERVFVLTSSDERLETELERFFFQKGRVVLKLKGFDSIEQAETLRDAEICIPSDEAVELDDDEYFDWELEGCRIKTIDGDEIGRVSKIFRAGENINLVVVEDGKEYMIPFVEVICPVVDIENKLIKVDLPEGLREL